MANNEVLVAGRRELKSLANGLIDRGLTFEVKTDPIPTVVVDDEGLEVVVDLMVEWYRSPSGAGTQAGFRRFLKQKIAEQRAGVMQP